MNTDGVISRFTARRSVRGSIGWALLLSIYFASKTIGFVKAYPTVISRQQIAAALGQNKGIEVLVGPAHHIETAAGYAAWNCLQIMVMIGAIWGLLLATKTLRGEEESGRWELLVSSPTTARRATGSILSGLAVSLVIFYAVLSLLTLSVGGMHDVQIAAKSLLFFNLVIVVGIALFVLVGALASQLLPTRGKAASVAAGVFGICLVLRAVGDITSAHWLLNITPLGWVEKSQALTGTSSLWLLPLIGLCALLLIGTLWLAGRRDLQASLVNEKSNRRPHLRLLNGPLGLTLRLSRASFTGWLLALGFLSFFYSALAKTALQILKSAHTNSPAVTKILHESSLKSSKAYLGAIFLILLLVLMAFAASLATAVRREEDKGYLDNILVRPVSRWRWLGGRLLFGSAALLIAGLTMALAAWVGVALQHLGLPINDLLEAGLNIVVASLFAFGAGIFAFGLWPRATSFVAYGVLIWSFLLNMLSSGINLSHWILDTSVLNQLALVPAVKPNWQVLGIMACMGVVLALIGGSAFYHRDLQAE